MGDERLFERSYLQEGQGEHSRPLQYLLHQITVSNQNPSGSNGRNLRLVAYASHSYLSPILFQNIAAKITGDKSKLRCIARVVFRSADLVLPPGRLAGVSRSDFEAEAIPPFAIRLSDAAWGVSLSKKSPAAIAATRAALDDAGAPYHTDILGKTVTFFTEHEQCRVATIKWIHLKDTDLPIQIAWRFSRTNVGL